MDDTLPVDKRWTYCPECGSTEIRHAEGDHKQCACCLQEWFADIDYTDVVRTNLGNRMQLRSSLTARDAEVAKLRTAVELALELWDIGLADYDKYGLTTDADVTKLYRAALGDIYWRNAPEMKPIREALKEA